MKGGVGKTTTVISLAETLATDQNTPVLVIDIDTQANASYCIAGDERLERCIYNNHTIDEFFYTKLVGTLPFSLEDIAQTQISQVTHLGQPLNVSLIASSPQLRVTEREIIHILTRNKYDMGAIEGRSTQVLGREIEKLREKYEYIIFDCAPGISAFTVAAITLSDMVIVPTIPDFLSHLGLTAFLKNVLRDIGKRDRPTRPYVLITRKTGHKQHSQYHEELIRESRKADARFSLFETTIPESTKFPRALNSIEEGQLTYRRKYESPLDTVLSDLAAEVKRALYEHNH